MRDVHFQPEFLLEILRPQLSIYPTALWIYLIKFLRQFDRHSRILEEHNLGPR